MKDWFRERFHGLYWRQMAVTVGMVFLTLVLLGVSVFFPELFLCPGAENR